MEFRFTLKDLHRRITIVRCLVDRCDHRPQPRVIIHGTEFYSDLRKLFDLSSSRFRLFVAEDKRHRPADQDVNLSNPRAYPTLTIHEDRCSEN